MFQPGQRVKVTFPESGFSEEAEVVYYYHGVSAPSEPRDPPDFDELDLRYEGDPKLYTYDGRGSSWKTHRDHVPVIIQ